MSSNPDRRHRATTSQDTITSPTAQQPPKFTPSSHLRLTPSNRTSLSEASNASSRHSASTIRIVDDPARNVYDKFPLPSEPSQIFPPPRNAPGYAFETPGSRVSSGSRVANALAKFEAIGASSTLAPQPPSYRPKNTFRHSASTNTSEDDTLVGTGNSRSSFRFSQGSTPPVSPGQAELKDFDTELEVLEEETTPPARRSTIRPVPPSSSGGESVESRLRALSPQESVASFASNPTTASPTASPSSPSNADRNATGVIRPLPPAESEDTRQQALDIDDSHRQVVLKPSDESFAYSDISSTSIEPKQPTYSPSPPLYEASSATWSSGAKVTHPVVRPAANNQRVIPQDTPNIAARMLVDHGLEHNWSSQLSTIASVSERDSRSVTRTPRSFSPRSQSTDSYAEKSQTHLPLRRRGQTIGSYNSSSDNYSSSPSGSVVPLPLFSPQLSPSGEYNEKSFGDEDLDTVSPLPPSNTIRMKNSGYLRRKDSEASLASSVKSSRPGSSHSDVSTFNRSIIPAWARAYYQRGERISMIPAASESSGSIRLGTSHSGRTHTPSESNFPAHIYRPRNRPHNNRASHADTMSPMSLSSEQLIDENGYAAGSYPPSVSGWSTPHLRTDRRGQPRYSFWKAPSMDKDFGRHPFSRQNRQILLFTLGFIFFPSWWIASCLPLPYDPALVQNESQVDFEQQYAQQIALADNKAYQKANWWRNLNRVMSGVGTLLIGVIVVLAILASRM